jgi:hypothetical protein
MNLRKRYLVHRKFQLDFTLKVLLAVFAPVFICTIFVSLYLIIGGWLPGAHLQHLLNPGFWFAFLLRALPVAFAVIVFTILFSHRIAGPVKRMQAACRERDRGQKPSPIILRKKDYFHRLAQKLNLLMESPERAE